MIAQIFTKTPLKNFKFRWEVIAFFAIFLIIGIFIYRDYGVPFDEKAQIEIGDLNYRYITHTSQELLTFKDRYYGPFFEIPFSFFAKNLTPQQFVYLRHLVVFLFFFIGAIFFYFIALRLLKNSWWALITTIMLVLSPRIFADSFYNSKDIPFMAANIMGIWSLTSVIDHWITNPKNYRMWGLMGIHSLFCAVAIAIRVPGIILIGLSLVIFMALMIISATNRRLLLSLIFSFLLLTFGFTVLFWPILWNNPIGEFSNAFLLMSRFPWPGSTLYLGKFIQAKNAVWHYLPIWISISTPYLPLGGFIIGCFSLLIAVINRFRFFVRTSFISWKELITGESLNWLTVFGWFVVPIAAILGLHSILYDGWRQMFFIYPPMVLIGAYGLKTVHKWLTSIARVKHLMEITLRLILVLGVLEPLLFMVNNHPFENVYFNFFSGNPKTLRQRFEMDYWGLSNKQSVDAILAGDKREKIKISGSVPALLYVQYLLPPQDAARLVFVETKKADYLITNYRFHPYDFPYKERFFSIRVNGVEIMTAYVLPPTK